MAPPPIAGDAAGGGLPPYVGPTDAPEGKKGRGKIIALAVGAVAVVGGGVFALSNLMSDDGANGPGDAVEQMFEAIDHDDVLGILDALPPGERDALRDPVIDITDELKRLGILANDANLESVGGVDFTVKNVETEAEAVGKGVSRVRVTGGEISVKVNGDDVPVGDVLTNLVEKSGGSIDIPDMSDTGDLADAGIELIAIEEDGGWHVSLAYSLAEAIRGDSGLPAPDFGKGIKAIGADSPEGAVEGMLQSITDLNLTKVIGYTDPREFRALYDYAPLFIGEAQGALDNMRESGGVEVSVDDIKLDASGSGDTREVAIKSMKLGFTGEGMSGSVALADNCVTLDIDGMNDPFADLGVAGNKLCPDDLEGKSPLGDLERATSGIVVSKHDGKWYVSPTRTLGAGLVSFLKSIDRDQLENADNFMDAFFGDLAPLLTGSEFQQFEDGFDDDFGLDTGSSSTTVAGGGELEVGKAAAAPTGFAALDGLAGDCNDGSMGACDDLFLEADFNDGAQKPYSDYGLSCGGRISTDLAVRGDDSCADLLGEFHD